MKSPFTSEEQHKMACEHYLTYAGAARALGVEALKRVVEGFTNAKEIRECFSEDACLNNMALKTWDLRHTEVLHLVGTAPRERWLKHAKGIFGGYAEPAIIEGKRRPWSLSHTVCVLKHVAIYHVSGLPAPCEYTPLETKP